MVFEVRIEVTSGEERRGRHGAGPKTCFWSAGNILFLDLVTGYLDLFVKILKNCTLLMGILFCMCFILP